MFWTGLFGFEFYENIEHKYEKRENENIVSQEIVSKQVKLDFPVISKQSLYKINSGVLQKLYFSEKCVHNKTQAC